MIDRLAGWREFAHGGTDGTYHPVLKRHGPAARHGLPAVAYEPPGAVYQLLKLAKHGIAALGQLGQPVGLLTLTHRRNPAEREDYRGRAQLSRYLCLSSRRQVMARAIATVA